MDENTFRDKKREARQDYILSGIEGYVDARRFSDAELLMASGVFDEDLTREQRVRAEKMIEVGRKDALLSETRAQAAAEKAEKQLQEETANLFTVRLWEKDAEPLTYADVTASNLTATQKRVFLNILDDRAKITVTNEPLYNELFNAVAVKEIRPDNMVERVLPFLGNGISGEDYSRLRNFADKIQGEEESQAIKNFLTMAKAQITKSNLFTNDPAGDRLYFEFLSRFNKRIDEAREKGVSLTPLLDPSSSDYIGPMINSFVRSPRQQIQDRGDAIRGLPPIPEGGQ
jgi:hypothetical protein